MTHYEVLTHNKSPVTECDIWVGFCTAWGFTGQKYAQIWLRHGDAGFYLERFRGGGGADIKMPTLFYHTVVQSFLLCGLDI